MTPQFISYVESRTINALGTSYPGMQVQVSNMTVTETGATFVAVHVLASDDVTPINLGIESKSRNVGIIQIDVYTPKDMGAGEGGTIGKVCAGLFKRITVSVWTEGQATFKDPVILDRGTVRGMHKTEMRVPYRYDFTDE